MCDLEGAQSRRVFTSGESVVHFFQKSLEFCRIFLDKPESCDIRFAMLEVFQVDSVEILKH